MCSLRENGPAWNRRALVARHLRRLRSRESRFRFPAELPPRLQRRQGWGRLRDAALRCGERIAVVQPGQDPTAALGKVVRAE